MKLFVRYWLPLVAWASLILLASGDLLSGAHTSRFLVPFLRWLIPDISPETLATIHFAVRKLAHLTEYAILATLLWRALRGTWKLPGIGLISAAFLGSAAFAAADEFRQSFIPSRTASPWDVLIDCCGAAIGLLIATGFTRRAATKKVRRNQQEVINTRS